MTDVRHTAGSAGEDLAAEHFERLGFEVLARNHRTRFGELDLVAYDGETLVFAEVKTRRVRLPRAVGEPPRRASGPRSAGWRSRGSPRAPTARTARELRFDGVAVLLDAAAATLVRLDHLEAAF